MEYFVLSIYFITSANVIQQGNSPTKQTNKKNYEREFDDKGEICRI